MKKIYFFNIQIRDISLTWLFPFFLLFIAAFIRFRFDTAINYLLIGSDGPYYPLQVRTLLEHGRLAFADMPLIFVLEAFFAKILHFLHFATFESSVILAVQWVDILLPPLAIIPVLGIAWEFSGKNKQLPSFRNLNGLLLTFSILNYTTVWAFMNSGLQKNALAVVWVFGYLYYLICFLKRHEKSDFYKAILGLLLCALTHFGCFSIILTFTAFLSCFWVKIPAKLSKVGFLQYAILMAVLSLLFILYYFDNQRFERLRSIPFKVFQNPIYQCLLNGGNRINPINLINSLFFNFLSIFALILLFYYRKKWDTFTLKMGSALAIFSLFLSSPFIGLEWWTRLNIMVYIPITVLYLLLFQAITSKWVKIAPALIFAFFVVFALGFAIKGERTGNITEAAYSELLSMCNSVQVPTKALTIGRQDHRLLASWVLHTRNCADYYFKSEDLDKYDAVYVLHQLKGDNLIDARFKEKPIPTNATLIFKGVYFELYQLGKL
jgi:hypothetical protein